MNKPTAAIAAFCLLNSASLYALGVGEIETQSALNQVLRAKIPLLSSKNEDPNNVHIGIASREVFQKSGIDRPHYLTEIKFTPVLNKKGEITIEVLSNSTIKEPFVNFILEIEWPQGRTLKEFTILLDPPVTMAGIQPTPVQLAHSSKKKPTDTVTRTHQVTSSPTQKYGPVKSSDTIWGIAKTLTPSNSPAEHKKVMLALYDNNPKAFYKKNINALKKGAILQAPSQQQINSRTSAQANTQYNEQNSLWSSTSSRKSTAKTSQANKKTAATSSKERKQQNTNEGQLTLLTTSKQNSTGVTIEGNSLDTPIGSSNPEIQASMALEMATTLEAENNDVKSRLNDLETQVEKLHRLIALKDKQLAQLQSSKPVQVTTAKAVPIVEKTTPSKKEPILDTSDENIPLYAGAALLIALLGLVLARRKKKEPNDILGEESSDIDPTNSDNQQAKEQAANITENSDTSITEEEPLLSEFTPSEFNDSTQTQEADPLTECDVYIAYGRYQQAEDLIESALKTDPSNLDYKLKLLDVHFASGNADAFEKLAEDLKDSQQSNISGWNNIVDMGSELCPNSPLFTLTNDFNETQEIDNTDELEFYAQQESNIQSDAPHTVSEETTITDENITEEQDNVIEFTPVEPEPSDDEGATVTDSKDDGEFEFDFDLIKNEADHHTETQATDDQVEFDDVFADENNEDTKISLAQAYIEMEDHTSARESLEEVLESGNEEQKQRAQSMLDKL